MWLTPTEVRQQLKISPMVLHRLRRTHKIRFIKIGTQFRYEIPPACDRIPDIERVAFISYGELGTILGLSTGRITHAVSVGEFFPVAVGKRRYFTIKEVRRILAMREKRTGQAKQHVSKILITWLQHYLEKDTAPVQVLDSLLKMAGDRLDEPKRSRAMSELWRLFDAVDDILRS